MTAYQLATPNHITRLPMQAQTCPVTAAQLSVYLGLTTDETEPVFQQPMLEGLLMAALDAVQALSGVQLTQRLWQYRADRYPAARAGFGGLAPLPEVPAPWVTLNTAPVVSVQSVEVGGDTLDPADWRLDAGRVFITGGAAFGGAIVIDYTAGAVVEWGNQAILATAAYLYEHRGGCDATDAVRQSTAWGLIKPHRIIGGGL